MRSTIGPLLLLLTFSSQAQFNFPFPSQHAVWTQWVDRWSVDGMPQYLGREYFSYYMTDADTVIAGVIYAQVFDHNGVYKAAVRDSVGKVKVVPAEAQVEYLLYDFTIPAGVDTLLEVWLIHDMYPSAVQMHGEGPIGNGGRVVVQGEGFAWIEGIGCTSGLFMEPWINVSGWWPELMCMSSDGMFLYPNEGPGTCLITTGIAQGITEPIRLYPNPAMDELVVECNVKAPSLPYTVLAADGRVLLRGVLRGSGGRIVTSALPAGCYLLEMGNAQNPSHATFLKVD